MQEAVELGHAWVQAVADARGIRVLFIKGPGLHRQGLRRKRVSADVDVLVEPARFAELCEAIRDSGWRTRPENFISQRTTLHSEALLRQGWPCDLDLHGFYPGFLAAPDDVFEALWARHERMTFASADCNVPDRVSGMLILALHSLRSAKIEPRHGDELEQLMRVPFSDRERADAAALALATGCAATLQSVLVRLGIAVEPPAAEFASAELREWRERVAAGSYGAYFWLYAWRHADGRDRFSIVWRAFWPTRADLLATRPETVDTTVGRLRARIARWRRGVGSLPGAIRAIWRYRTRHRAVESDDRTRPTT